ncbi:MAG: hypothetical protein JWO06_2118 [Bacteroidota bacterium]|nr:hypothetical protein [Bacteroidota bacterium]
MLTSFIIKRLIMKHNVVSLLLLLIVGTGFAQNRKYELPARDVPTVTKGMSGKAKYVTDLSPLLWSSLVIPQNERYYLDQRRVRDFPQPQPTNYLYPQEKYKLIIDYVEVEFSINSNGKTLSAKGTGDKLNSEQKKILNAADVGTDISVKIKFKYKNQANDEFGSRNKVVEGTAKVKVVPETEAEYPGGFNQLSDYFVENVINKISDKNGFEKVQRAELKFTVNEEGEIMDAKISRTSTDAKIDKLLLEATEKMPRWQPAENSKGVRVKQEICIPFSVGC